MDGEKIEQGGGGGNPLAEKWKDLEQQKRVEETTEETAEKVEASSDSEKSEAREGRPSFAERLRDAYSTQPTEVLLALWARKDQKAADEVIDAILRERAARYNDKSTEELMKPIEEALNGEARRKIKAESKSDPGSESEPAPAPAPAVEDSPESAFQIPEDNGEVLIGGTIDAEAKQQMIDDLAQNLSNQDKKSIISRVIKHGVLGVVTQELFRRKAGQQVESVLAEKGLQSTGESEAKPEGKFTKAALDKLSALFRIGTGEQGEKETAAARALVARHVDANLIRAREALKRGEASAELPEDASAADRMRKLLNRNEKIAKINGLDARLAVKDGKLVSLEEGEQPQSINTLMTQMVSALNGAETPEARAALLQGFDGQMQAQVDAWVEAGVLQEGEAGFLRSTTGENGEVKQSQFMQLLDKLAQAQNADDQVSDYIQKFALYRAENLNTEGSEHESLDRKSILDRMSARIGEKLGYPVSAVLGAATGYWGTSLAKSAVRTGLLSTGVATIPAGLIVGGVFGAAKGMLGAKSAIRERLRRQMDIQGSSIEESENPDENYAKILDKIKGEVLDENGALKADFLENLDNKLKDGNSPANAQELAALARYFAEQLGQENVSPEIKASSQDLLGRMMVLQDRMDKGFWSSMSYMGREDIATKQRETRQAIIRLYDKVVGTDEQGNVKDTDAAAALEQFVADHNGDESEEWKTFVKNTHGEIRREKKKYIKKRAFIGGAFGGAAAAGGMLIRHLQDELGAAAQVDNVYTNTGGNAIEDTTDSVGGVDMARSHDALNNALENNANAGTLMDTDGDGLYELTYTDVDGGTHTIEDLDFSTPGGVEGALQTLRDNGFDVDATEIGQNFAAGNTVSVEEYINSNPDLVSAVTSREWETNSDIVVGNPIPVDVDGDGVPDQFDIPITSSSGSVDVDLLDFAVTANEATEGNVLMFDVENGRVTIPAGSGIVDANGDFAGRFGEVVSNNGGAMTTYSTIEGGGIDQITTYDRYPTYGIVATSQDATLQFETPGVVAEHDWEAVGNTADPSNQAIVTEIDENGNVVSTSGVVNDVNESAGYSRSTDPYFEAAKQSPNAFGASEYDPNATPSEVMNEYVMQVSESPEQLEMLRSGLGMPGSASTVEELNARADDFEAMSESEQIAHAAETRDALIERLDGGTVITGNLSDSPMTASSYITSDADGNTILHTYHTSTPTTVGHFLTAKTADGSYIFDTPQIRQILGIPLDAEGYVVLRRDCAFQWGWVPARTAVEDFVPTPHRTTTTTTTTTTTVPDEPDTDEPDTDEPDTDEPDTDEPDTDEPDIDEPDIDEPDIDEPDTDEPEEPEKPEEPEEPGVVTKGPDTHAGDSSEHPPLDNTPTTSEREAETGNETIGAVEENHTNPDVAPGSEVNYNEQNVSVDDNTAFDQADADTATSPATTTQHSTSTDRWQNVSSAPEPQSSNAASESVNTGNGYTISSQEQLANINAGIQSEIDASQASPNDAAAVDTSVDTAASGDNTNGTTN